MALTPAQFGAGIAKPLQDYGNAQIIKGTQERQIVQQQAQTDREDARIVQQQANTDKQEGRLSNQEARLAAKAERDALDSEFNSLRYTHPSDPVGERRITDIGKKYGEPVAAEARIYRGMDWRINIEPKLRKTLHEAIQGENKAEALMVLEQIYGKGNIPPDDITNIDQAITGVATLRQAENQANIAVRRASIKTTVAKPSKPKYVNVDGRFFKDKELIDSIASAQGGIIAHYTGLGYSELQAQEIMQELISGKRPLEMANSVVQKAVADIDKLNKALDGLRSLQGVAEPSGEDTPTSVGSALGLW